MAKFKIIVRETQVNVYECDAEKIDDAIDSHGWEFIEQLEQESFEVISIEKVAE